MKYTQLPEHFLEDHPFKEISAARLTHIQMITIMFPDLNEAVAEQIISEMEQPRYENYQAERALITNAGRPEDIVSCMRKIKDPVNLNLLIDKALEYQDEVIPMVLDKIRKSGHDIFIERAAVLIANADEKYTGKLYDIFPDIRNAYARSEMCVVFGAMKKAEYTPLLMEQYYKIKEERPDTDYEQGPLLALHLIHAKE